MGTTDPPEPEASPVRPDWVQKLVAAGRLSPATRAKPAHPPRPAEVSGSASALVLAERDAERWR